MYFFLESRKPSSRQALTVNPNLLYPPSKIEELVMVVATTNASQAQDSRKARSKIFEPFRAIGYVTADVPICVQPRGNVHAITTSVGSTFHIYDGEKLNLLFTGPQSDTPILAVAVSRDRVFAASGSEVIIAERGREVGRLQSEDCGTIFSLVVFGNLLLALCENNAVVMWDHTTQEHYHSIEFPDSFRVTSALHPSTYLNKILFSSQQGSMQLWNLRTLRQIFEFPTVGSPITFLTQAPSVDVVAMGLLDGTIILHNIRVNVEILRLKQEGKVSAISFRTDNSPHMATASLSGDLAIWDLEKQQLIHIEKGAHEGAVHSAYFFAGQPILVTAGGDNSLKQWIFDGAEGSPRLLRSRGGHYDPPTRIRYHPFEATHIISGGSDQSLRVFSATRDATSIEISLRDKKLKSGYSDDARIPPIASFEASEGLESRSVNIVSAHVKEFTARASTYGGKPITRRTYSCTDQSLIKSVAVSACGNFGFVGSLLGKVDRYNLQSGLFRKTYEHKDGHKKAVTGIASDRVNRTVVTGSLDGTIKFWGFHSGALQESIDVSTAVNSILLHRESNLLAAACDDFVIRIIDITTKKCVREFVGHRSHITDMTFSPDGRLLVSASVDSTLRTWDLPTGYLVDILRCASVPRSVSFSPSADFLATAHTDQIGIFLWANRMQFSKVDFRNLSEEEAVDVELPRVAAKSLDDDETESMSEQQSATENGDTLQPFSEDDSLISLSGQPKLRWQNLLSLDALKERNKPAEAPKAEAASFFLPTIREMEQKFGTTKKSASGPADDANAEKSRIMSHRMDADLEPEFVRLLREGSLIQDYSAAMQYILSLSPSAIDVTIRSISTDSFDPLSGDQLTHLLAALEWHITSRRDFEAVEAILHLILQVHASALGSEKSEAVRLRMDSLRQGHKQTWSTLEEMFQYSLCMLDFVKI
ncbi:quinon protein alcohol dehydrogenase-like superfamily [Phlyctochytrium arcticum]|nr:quinon protein alcohol dehydrogenase-like superfamily [Phlyctochytrium arcticum]